MKRKRFVHFSLVLVILMNLFAFAGLAAAETGDVSIPASNTNISSTSSTDGTDDVTKILDGWITKLRVIGIVISVFGIVLGAIVFSVSLGNAQRRALGISAMLAAAIGIIIIAKAHKLAGYFVHS